MQAQPDLDRHGHAAQPAFIGAVIGASVLVLAAETDYGHLAVWWYLDNAFLAVFLAEVVLRLLYIGVPTFFLGADKLWNLLDFVTVAFGLIELFASFMEEESEPSEPEDREYGSGHSRDAPVIRVLRLMRLLRLLRFFRMIRKLRTLAMAISAMMESFVIIFSVLFAFVMVCAILCTHLLGHGEGLDSEHPEFEALFPQIQANFGDIPTAGFSLFQVTTLDNWIDLARPVINLDKRWEMFFVVFIGFSSWTMISVLTAVASDSMVAAASDREVLAAREQEEKRAKFLTFLRNAFMEFDADGNGLLDKTEFDDLIAKDQVRAYIRKQGISMTTSDLENAWDLLDVHKTGELTIDEFVTGLAFLQEGLSTKHIANVDYTQKRTSAKAVENLERIRLAVAAIKDRNSELEAGMKTHNETSQQEAQRLRLFLQWVTEKYPDTIPRDVLQQFDRVKMPGPVPEVQIRKSALRSSYRYQV